MLLSLLISLALQLQPRFTMTPAADDMIRAEFFEIPGGLTDDQIPVLLGGAAVLDSSVEEVPGQGRMRLIRASRPDGGLVALIDAPGHAVLGDKVCRMSNDLPGTINNAPRALQWCRSFYLPLTVVPVTPPPAGG